MGLQLLLRFWIAPGILYVCYAGRTGYGWSISRFFPCSISWRRPMSRGFHSLAQPGMSWGLKRCLETVFKTTGLKLVSLWDLKTTVLFPKKVDGNDLGKRLLHCSALQQHLSALQQHLSGLQQHPSDFTGLSWVGMSTDTNIWSSAAQGFTGFSFYQTQQKCVYTKVGPHITCLEHCLNHGAVFLARACDAEDDTLWSCANVFNQLSLLSLCYRVYSFELHPQLTFCAQGVQLQWVGLLQVMLI